MTLGDMSPGVALAGGAGLHAAKRAEGYWRRTREGWEETMAWSCNKAAHSVTSMALHNRGGKGGDRQSHISVWLTLPYPTHKATQPRPEHPACRPVLPLTLAF